MILATSSELIQEIKKAREDVLSQRKPARGVYSTIPGLDSNSNQQRQRLGMDYTLRLLNNEDMYQNGVIRTKLTRNIGATFGEVQDELIEALSKFILVGSHGT